MRRIARGAGLGARVVAALEEAVLRYLGDPSMGFYERCGYRVLNGRRYLDAGIWHQDMARTVSTVSAADSAGSATCGRPLRAEPRAGKETNT